MLVATLPIFRFRINVANSSLPVIPLTTYFIHARRSRFKEPIDAIDKRGSPMAYDFARYLNIRSAIMPAMAPDGRRIAFLTDITGVYQLWSVAAPAADPTDPAARWPVQLTFFADKVWEFHAAPAAGHLIAVSDADGNERQQFYLVTGYGDGAHDVRRLTNDDRAIHRFGVFSSDGGQIVYTSNARNHVDFDPYWMDLTTGESRRIASAAGNCTIVAWSPDGGTLLMVDAQAAEQHELYLVDLASGAERHLTAGRAPARYLALTWTTGGLFTLSDRECDRFALCRRTRRRPRWKRSWPRTRCWISPGGRRASWSFWRSAKTAAAQP